MAFPNDLADVAAFKIHPAIGCARLASNEDFYEFFDYEEKRKAGQAQSLKYMSLRDGKHRIMRQAVRFRIFAYRSDGREIGELTADIMAQLGLSATWTASVANRKLNVWSQGATPAVEAQASATAGETKRLEGNNPWRPGKVWLGEITGDGLFIPPMGGVYRKTAEQRYSALWCAPKRQWRPGHDIRRLDKRQPCRRGQSSGRARLRHRRSAGSLPRCEPGAGQQFPESGLCEGNAESF